MWGWKDRFQRQWADSHRWWIWTWGTTRCVKSVARGTKWLATLLPLPLWSIFRLCECIHEPSISHELFQLTPSIQPQAVFQIVREQFCLHWRFHVSQFLPFHFGTLFGGTFIPMDWLPGNMRSRVNVQDSDIERAVSFELSGGRFPASEIVKLVSYSNDTKNPRFSAIFRLKWRLSFGRCHETNPLFGFFS